MRILSGIQPSGRLHVGNYFGALQQHIQLQNDGEALYFIANLHSLTSLRDARRLRTLTSEVALDYLALGLTPDSAVLFRQSDVPEVTELMWILATVTGRGLLERAHSYKDKVAHGIIPTMGLMCYPILMAADILIYRSDVVPVGKDQLQHVEMTQDMAGFFNNAFGREIFLRPEARLNDAPLVPGLDGRKMSKSYGNTIDLFLEPQESRARIAKITTDSLRVAEAKDPEACNVFALLRLFADKDEASSWARRYRSGGVSYGEAKRRLAELYEELFGEARERRSRLSADMGYVEDILNEGGVRAREIARGVMADVRDACGIR